MLAQPGRVYPITIDAGVTSNEFGRGHRVRIEVSSSNFPHYDRNPNTGGAVADEKELRRAKQTVYHDRLRPSHVLLPVIPEGAAPAVARQRRSPPSPSPPAARREVQPTALRPPGGRPF